MIVFLLVVIILIMLVGGAAVAGAVGAFLGLFVALLLMVWLKASFAIVFWIVVSILGFLLLVGMFADPIEKLMNRFANNRSKPD